MSFKPEVILQHDDLNREVFTFWYRESDHSLYLDNYETQQRASKRHKFKRLKWYSRLWTREASIKNVEDVPLTDAIRERAIAQFVESLAVKTSQR